MKNARLRMRSAIYGLIFAGALISPPARATSFVFAAPSAQTTPSAEATPSAQSSPSVQAPRETTIRSEEAKTEEQPDPLHTTAGKALRWVNFLILLGAIVYFTVKKGVPAFRAHANEISAGITSAAAAKAEADAQLRKAEAGLARLDQDSAGMREEAKKEFVMESDRLRAGGEQEVDRIEHAAVAEISAAQRAARIELRGMAARLAAQRAAELVPEQITPTQRAALMKRFVDELPATADGRGVN
jgi:F-type H+-transporting ATPase subunit b